MDTFPTAPHASPADVQAELPAAQKAFAQEYPKFEIVQFTPTGLDFGYQRNELSGSVTGRMLAAHVQFRFAGKCYYAKPLFLEEHVDTSWGPPHILELQTPTYDDYPHYFEPVWVEHARAVPMTSCGPMPATATAGR